MRDLEALFASLIQEWKGADWRAALLASPLGGAQVLGHPLGFRVARLDEGGTSLRLHLWRGVDATQPGFEVHDHGFDLESFVLAGTIRQRTYAADRDPSGEQVIYAVAYEADESVLRKTDQVVRLREVKSEVFEAGEIYRVAAGELHASYLDGCDVGATLVLTHNRGGQPITLGPKDSAPDLRASRSPLSALSLREMGWRAAEAL